MGAGKAFSIQRSFLISVCSLVFTAFVMTKHIYKYPRLYLNEKFAENERIFLSIEHVHYLKNVLRKNKGDILRLFNGHDGEWLARIDELSKKICAVILTENIKNQPSVRASLNLYFSPIKKQRMDFLIEKAVELGVDGLYPVIMNRTENRKLNIERTRTQIIEAAEQCERMSLPMLHASQKFSDILSIKEASIYICWSAIWGLSRYHHIHLKRGVTL